MCSWWFTPAAAPGLRLHLHGPGGLPLPVKAVDTTGAGDGFIGFFRWQLCRDGVNDSLPSAARPSWSSGWYSPNRYCGESVQRYGATASYPTAAQMGA